MADDQFKTRFYAEPKDEGEVPAWVLAGGAILVALAAVLVIGGGVALAAAVLERFL